MLSTRNTAFGHNAKFTHSFCTYTWKRCIKPNLMRSTTMWISLSHFLCFSSFSFCFPFVIYGQLHVCYPTSRIFYFVFCIFVQPFLLQNTSVGRHIRREKIKKEKQLKHRIKKAFCMFDDLPMLFRLKSGWRNM